MKVLIKMPWKTSTSHLSEEEEEEFRLPMYELVQGIIIKRLLIDCLLSSRKYI